MERSAGERRKDRAGAVIDDEHLQRTLASVAESATQDHTVADVLYQLVDDASRIFDVSGAAISMADDDGRLRSVTSFTEAIASLEIVEQETQEGPCHESHRRGEPVRVRDLREHADRWPDLAAAAERTGIVAAAVVPMHLESSELGVFTLYDTRPHQWKDRQVEVAQLLADATTAYLAYSSAYRQATTVVSQLKRALESRIIIEQAKGALANERSISVDAAFEILRRHSRENNAKLSAVAHAVVHLGLRP